MIPLLFLIWILDVGGLAIGAWILWKGPGAAHASVRRDLMTGFVVSLAVGVAAVGMGIVGRGSAFGAMRLICHALFCVIAPLCIARGLWWLRPTRSRAFGALLIALGASMIGVYAYARRIAPYDLEITTHAMDTDRIDGLDQPLRVVLLADLQTDGFGAYEERVAKQIHDLKPDVLLLAGDYLHFPYDAERGGSSAKLTEQLTAWFRSVQDAPRLGAFAVLGNTDHSDTIFDGTSIRHLRNRAVRIPGVPLQIWGVQYSHSGAPLSARAHQAVRDFPGFTIVMGHRPDFMLGVLASPTTDEMLMVAGHTHGGQVVIPGLGPPLTLTKMPRRIAAGGLHRLGAAWACVSRGVGLERLDAPRIRLFCRPQLVVFDLE